MDRVQERAGFGAEGLAAGGGGAAAGSVEEGDTSENPPPLTRQRRFWLPGSARVVIGGEAAPARVRQAGRAYRAAQGRGVQKRERESIAARSTEQEGIDLYGIPLGSLSIKQRQGVLSYLGIDANFLALMRNTDMERLSRRLAGSEDVGVLKDGAEFARAIYADNRGLGMYAIYICVNAALMSGDFFNVQDVEQLGQIEKIKQIEMIERRLLAVQEILDTYSIDDPKLTSYIFHSMVGVYMFYQMHNANGMVYIAQHAMAYREDAQKAVQEVVHAMRNQLPELEKQRTFDQILTSVDKYCAVMRLIRFKKSAKALEKCAEIGHSYLRSHAYLLCIRDHLRVAVSDSEFTLVLSLIGKIKCESIKTLASKEYLDALRNRVQSMSQVTDWPQ